MGLIGAIGATGFVESLRSLLPPGIAWQGATMKALVDAFAPELARIEAAAGDLADETFPGTSTTLIPEWKTLVGLPDPDFAMPTDLAEIRAAIVSRMATIRTPTAAELERVAFDGGFVVRITESATAYTFDIQTFTDLTVDEQNRLISIIKRFKPAHLVASFDFRDTIFRAGMSCGRRLVEF